nr:PREDICTED: uncharacterized protein LOC109043194 [Bemisia tabaci]
MLFRCLRIGSGLRRSVRLPDSPNHEAQLEGDTGPLHSIAYISFSSSCSSVKISSAFEAYLSLVLQPFQKPPFTMYKFVVLAAVLAVAAAAPSPVYVAPVVAHPVPVVHTAPVVHAAPVVPVVKTVPVVHHSVVRSSVVHGSPVVPVVRTAPVVAHPVVAHPVVPVVHHGPAVVVH